jgi:hypothetical protein
VPSEVNELDGISRFFNKTGVNVSQVQEFMAWESEHDLNLKLILIPDEWTQLLCKRSQFKDIASELAEADTTLKPRDLITLSVEDTGNHLHSLVAIGQEQQRYQAKAGRSENSLWKKSTY